MLLNNRDCDYCFYKWCSHSRWFHHPSVPFAESTAAIQHADVQEKSTKNIYHWDALEHIFLQRNDGKSRMHISFQPTPAIHHTVCYYVKYENIYKSSKNRKTDAFSFFSSNICTLIRHNDLFIWLIFPELQHVVWQKLIQGMGSEFIIALFWLF